MLVLIVSLTTPLHATATQADGRSVVQGEPVFLPDDPIHTDPDRIPLDTIPLMRPFSDWANAVRVMILDPGDYSGHAVNVNTLGDVPGSSWFRGDRPADRTPVEMARGPNTTGGPVEGVWRVVDIKTEGVSPGMTIVDARGDRYLLKFDDPDYPAMASSAEVISTKLFHALGYHVPENYVAFFSSDSLQADTSEGISPEDVEGVVADLKIRGGRHRALASLFLDGNPIGPFLYSGRRTDDANDIFPHEARRELRGMKLAAAWVDHFDSRAGNTLDMVVEGMDGGRYVRHHLLDFGSTLGGGALGPKRLWYGHERSFDVSAILARMFTFGFAASDWATIGYPDVATVGRFTAKSFDPSRWVPAFRNPAFDRMDARDAFWMAARIAAIGDDDLRAIVETGRYPVDSTTAYVCRTLAERRDRIARAYLGLGGGLDHFRVVKSRGETEVRFHDLAREHGLAGLPETRRFGWYRYDNRRPAHAPLDPADRIATGTSSSDRVALPATSGPGYLVVEIETPDFGKTRVFLRCREQTADTCEVVGVKRRGSDEGWSPGWG